MQRFFALILLSASLIGLTACGNKGPLYLPPEPVQQTPVEQEEEAQPTEGEDAQPSDTDA